jgi:hypothetical protein
MNSAVKNILKSRTIWFNVVSIIAEVSGTLATVLPPGTTLVVVNAINIGLRLITTSNLFDK